MGAGQSTPKDSKHIFSSDTPINFSPEIVEALQASTETNSTRAKSLELHIAQRVAAELEKIQKHESSTLDSLRKKISESTDSSSSEKDKSSPSSKSSSNSLLSIPSISAKDLVPQSTESKEEQAKKAQSSQKVQQEIEKLKQTLGQRKVLKDLPRDVDKARSDVIGCLRMNDRRPLDCYKEVEVFKREVRKMEENFVSGVL